MLIFFLSSRNLRLFLLIFFVRGLDLCRLNLNYSPSKHLNSRSDAFLTSRSISVDGIVQVNGGGLFKKLIARVELRFLVVTGQTIDEAGNSLGLGVSAQATSV